MLSQVGTNLVAKLIHGLFKRTRLNFLREENE